MKDIVLKMLSFQQILEYIHFLEWFGLENRILSGTENIDNVLKYNIDFEEVNKKINEFRNESKAFLEEALHVKEVG